MFEVKGNDLYLTRGDTARLSVNIMNVCDDGEYTPAADDVFRFTVKKNVYTDEMIFQKISKGNAVFKILPSDTKELDFATYVYDIELTTADGDVYTVVPYSMLYILKEVTT